MAAASTLNKLAKCRNLWAVKMLLTPTRLCSFQALGINDVLVERLANFGIKRPSEIQEKALSAVLRGSNTIVNAETGSGKTLCYLLPILNNLMKNPSLLDKPPYSIVLLPTIELCTQVASVFKSLADPHLQPCIVHRESKLLVATSYPVVMAIPSALLAYNLDTLNNVTMVVTDEADFVTTSGGKDVWRLLNFLKHGKHLRKTGYGSKKSGKNQSSDIKKDLKLFPERQFVFVAATLPSRGKRASLNILSKWIPSAQIVASSIVHQKLPSLDVLNIKVTDDTKLSQLLSTLNQIAGLWNKDNTASLTEKTKHKGHSNEQLLKANCKSNTMKEKFEILPLCKEGEIRRSGDENSEGRGFELRVMVFANTAQQASKAFCYLTNEQSNDRTSDISTERLLDNNTKKTKLSTKYLKRKSDESLVNYNYNIDDIGYENEETPTVKNEEVGSKDYWMDKCAELHKDVPVNKRLESLEKFKSGELEVLICTDIASRGLDIPNITHVIQLDFAADAATCLHRTGRTARAGLPGKVINFITSKDEDLARALRACDDNTNDVNYEAAFSRNRMFRRRVKANTVPLADSI